MSDEFIKQMSKADLLARIYRDRAAFTALWQNLTPEQMMCRPGVQEDWSVKDLVAHMTFWENLILGIIETLLSGQIPNDYGDIDAVNAVVFAENKDRTLDEILAEWNKNLAKIEATIDCLSDEQINEVSAFPDMDVPLLYHIIGNTFGHIRNHRPDLERYLATLP